MNEELKKQLEIDTELAKSIAEIKTSQEITALVIRLVSYLELLEQAQADSEYRAKKFKNKIKTLMEYIRVGKDRARTLSIIEHEVSK